MSLKKKTSGKPRKTSSKRNGLIKRRKIKPKVKLDSNKVLILSVIICVLCVALVIVTVFVPSDTTNHSSKQDTVQLENKKTPPEVQTSKPKESSKASNKDAELKAQEERRKKEQEALALEEKKRQEQKLAEEKKRQEEERALELKKQQEEAERKKRAQEEELKRKQEQEKAVSFNFPQAKNNAQLVFLFDDGGQNLSHLDKFLKLPFPITIAVLPKLAYSKESAQKIRASGKELMLHQPMQAVNGSVNPGPGAIKPDMSESEIKSVLFQNLSEVGPVAGMNNHEGSAITADAQKMETILKYASDNGIYFLDSRTNKDTQVPYVSKALGYSYYERNGNFLDNVKTRENALAELRKNLDKANNNGVVIMIGHIWSADFLPQLLMDVYPELKQKGYTITTVSKCRGKK